MSTDTQRLFIGNLPEDIREQDLQNEFSSYGLVKKVEVKHKTNIDSGEIQNTFAFVSISIDERSLRQCLEEFKQEKYRGRYLQVTVARENFLEKLKREREEAAQLQAGKHLHGKNVKATDVAGDLPSFTTKTDAKSALESSSSSDDSSDEEIETAKPSNKLNGTKMQQSSSSSGSSDADADDDDDGNNLVLRKKSKIFMENGRIKIDRNVSGGGAIHVIERTTNKPAKKSLDEKSQKADQKRIESLKKLKNSYMEQKLAIKNALAGVDTSKRNNKIVFDDGDDDARETASTENSPGNVRIPKAKSVKKPSLFADNDDDEDDSMENYEKGFQIKEQFQGAKGEKLMRLQSRFQNDRRFNMDAKFLEDDKADDAEQGGQRKPQNGQNANEEAGDNEREWQYDILESIIGKKIRPYEPPKDTKKKAPPSMLRFDPTRADHTQFVETAKKRPKKFEKDDINAKRQKMDDDAPSVSMDQFYEIRGDLKKTMGSGGFSLLSMFGRSGDDAAAKTSGIENKYEEKPIAKNNAKFIADLDPFRYDSSGDEADNETRSKKIKQNECAADDSKTTNNGSIWHESFFIVNSNDERLNEGIAFFVPANDGEQSHDIDETKKQELRNIVKRKIKKSVKNALPRHMKPNKRFKRFTKNL